MSDYWGRDSHTHDAAEGRLLQRWKVRKWRSSYGPTTVHVWVVFEPGGSWSGTFESWGEAMDWATSVASRVEYWLEHQS